MRVSDHILHFVARQQVRHVFLVTGGGAMYLNDSLARADGIEPVCNGHEQASAIAAEAYAKATGNLGVAMVTTGPGGTNAVTGVAGAWLDSTPVLFISGQVKRSDRMFDAQGRPRGLRQLGVQEVDIVAIVRPITKYAVTVLDPADIFYHLEKSVYLARSGRPGPVWIDVPLDVQAATLDDPGALRRFDPAELGQAAPSGETLRDQVASVVAALGRAERPLIFVGNGVRLAGGDDALRRLRETLRLPVAATWCAADLVPSDDPLFVGRPGAVAARGANFALQNCDFLLGIGVRMDFAITGYAPERLARAAHKVLVDIDPAELAKLHPHIHQPIVADARDFLEEMLSQTPNIVHPDRSAWERRCAGWKARYPVVTPAHRAGSAVSIYRLAEVIGTETAPDDLLVSGSSGSGIEIFLLACPARSGQRIYHTAGLGAMGFGLPAAIGVCLAGGRRRTICVDGDGGFQFNIQELETVARLRLPIKFFVLNNGGYASIRASQRNWFGAARIGCDAGSGLTVPDLPHLAAGFGLPSAVIADQHDLPRQVRAVLDTDGPVICDVRVIPEESREPRLASMQRPDGSLVSKPLEDLFPFLDRDEFLSNMIIAPLAE
jgi:acetolactate synthase-1/2/3 large subunit